METNPFIKVEFLENGQRIVTKGNLVLTQTIMGGERFNDCHINHGEYCEQVSASNERFIEMYIALFKATH